MLILKLKHIWKPGIVVHAFNPSTQETETELIPVTSKQAKVYIMSYKTRVIQKEKPCLKKKNRKTKQKRYFKSPDLSESRTLSPHRTRDAVQW